MTSEEEVQVFPAAKQKLYIIGRKDLKPGLRAAQMVHAIMSHALSKPKETGEWFATSNNIVLLEVVDRVALEELLGRLVANGIGVVAYHEPDLGDELTAIATGGDAKRMLSNLPLALSC